MTAADPDRRFDGWQSLTDEDPTENEVKAVGSLVKALREYGAGHVQSIGRGEDEELRHVMSVALLPTGALTAYIHREKHTNPELEGTSVVLYKEGWL